MPLIQETFNYERGGTQKEEYSLDEVVEVACPLCGREDRERLYTEHGQIGIVRCRGCSLIYASPRLRAPEEVYWGDAQKFYEEARLIFEGRARHHRDPNYLEELRWIRRYRPCGRFLDVGCNMGMLLRHVQRMGWTAVGVEPSPSLARLASERFGLTVHNCWLRDLPVSEEGSFDVIALSDVLEHVADPLPFLRDAARFLADDGVLYVKVPNGRWNLFKQRMLEAMGRRPKQGVWDSYEHVVHYTDATLTQMLERGGFRAVAMTVGKPVQIPVWERHVGRYYQYPSPWIMDWKRYVGRSMFYWLSWPERWLRGGSIGSLAPDIAVLATKTGRPQ